MSFIIIMIITIYYKRLQKMVEPRIFYSNDNSFIMFMADCNVIHTNIMNMSIEL